MRTLVTIISSIFIFSGVSNATPEQYEPGVPTLKAFLDSPQYHTSKQTVVGMTGFYGQDQPRQWLILTRAENSEELSEFVMMEKNVIRKRKMKKLPNQALPTIEIEVDRLKVDSDIAFEIAELRAKKDSVMYDSVHYQLRCREQDNEPVWVVNMLDPAGKSIGIHYISAETGVLLRSVWHRANQESLTSAKKGPDGKPESLLYGGSVKEITVSGKAGTRKTVIRKVVAE